MSVYIICWIFLQTLQTYFCIQVNSVDPDQTAPRGAVWSGSILFAKMTFKITSRWQSRQQLLWLAVYFFRVKISILQRSIYMYCKAKFFTFIYYQVKQISKISKTKVAILFFDSIFWNIHVLHLMGPFLFGKALLEVKIFVENMVLIRINGFRFFLFRVDPL